MRLSDVIIFIFFGCSVGIAAEGVPILSEARGMKTITPAIFFMEDVPGGSGDVSNWIKLTTRRYYAEAISSLKSEIEERTKQHYASPDMERLLDKITADGTNDILPRWVENIFLVCRKSEIIISFYPRNGGWAELSNGSIAAFYAPAYICTGDPRSGVVKNAFPEIKTVIYANLYKNFQDDGIKTDVKEGAALIAPLNISRLPKEEAKKK